MKNKRNFIAFFMLLAVSFSLVLKLENKFLFKKEKIVEKLDIYNNGENEFYFVYNLNPNLNLKEEGIEELDLRIKYESSSKEVVSQDLMIDVDESKENYLIKKIDIESSELTAIKFAFYSEGEGYLNKWTEVRGVDLSQATKIDSLNDLEAIKESKVSYIQNQGTIPSSERNWMTVGLLSLVVFGTLVLTYLNLITIGDRGFALLVMVISIMFAMTWESYKIDNYKISYYVKGDAKASLRYYSSNIENWKYSKPLDISEGIEVELTTGKEEISRLQLIFSDINSSIELGTLTIGRSGEKNKIRPYVMRDRFRRRNIDELYEIENKNIQIKAKDYSRKIYIFDKSEKELKLGIKSIPKTILVSILLAMIGSILLYEPYKSFLKKENKWKTALISLIYLYVMTYFMNRGVKVYFLYAFYILGVLYILKHKKKKINILDILVVLFIMLSTIADITSFYEVKGIYTRLIKIFPLLLIVPKVDFNKKDKENIMLVILYSLSILIFEGIFLKAGFPRFGKFHSTNFMSISVIMAVVYTLKGSPKRKKVILYILMVLSLICMLKFNARSMTVSLAVAIPILILLTLDRKKGIIAVISLLILSMGVFISLPTNYKENIKSIVEVSGKNSSNNGRFEMWKMSKHIIIKYPYKGIGYTNFQKEANKEEYQEYRNYKVTIKNTWDHPHNEVLDVFTSTGVTNGIIYIFILINILVSSLKNLKINSNDPVYYIVFGVIVSSLVYGGFEPMLTRQSGYLLLLIFALGIIQNNNHEKEKLTKLGE